MPVSKLVGRSLAAALLLSMTTAVGWAADSVSKPNFVLIVADDLGYGDLGFQGGRDIPTPRIDGLARSGVTCSSGYVSGPYCSPTRAGLLTGRYQQRFGHEFNPGNAARVSETFGLSLNERTLPQRLKAAGYATGIVGKWHLGSAPQFQPLERGFDEFFGFLGGAHPYFPESKSNDPIRRGREAVDEPEYLTDAFARESVAYIDRNKDRPFFLYLAFNAVHNPQHAKPEHLDRFKSIADERRRTYAGMLTALDDAVGQVLDKLANEKLDQKTLVVFISDSGGPPANGSTNTPLNGQKATTWEGGVRVPFVLSWPGQLAAGKKYDEPVIQLDLLPTILTAAGTAGEDAAKLDGVDLAPFLKGEKAGAPHSALYWRFGEQIALRQGDWKLLKVRGDTKPRLYNLREDIGEQQDLAATKPELVARLQLEWDSWNTTLVPPSWIPAPQQQAGNRQNNK